MDLFDDDKKKDPPVHIRVQARNGRKSISSISGLARDLDLPKICKYLKKNFKCNGAVTKDKTYGNVILLQGDHREDIKQFLIDTEICSGEIILHGF